MLELRILELRHPTAVSQGFETSDSTGSLHLTAAYVVNLSNLSRYHNLGPQLALHPSPGMLVGFE
jgi:hypothetical protein